MSIAKYAQPIEVTSTASLMPDEVQSIQGIRTLGFKPQHPFQDRVPSRPENHVDDPRFLREFATWFAQPEDQGFFITGPAGVGKSTSVQAFLSSVNAPMLKVGCHRDTTMLELLGSTQLKGENGATSSEFHLGPVALAFKNGLTVVLEEMNAMFSDVLVGLNEIIRGETLLIEQTGEVIRRHPAFRIVATGNAFGGDDQASRKMHGIKPQNAAFLSRWWLFKMEYLPREREYELLKSVVRTVPPEVLHAVLNIAWTIRDQSVYLNPDDPAALDIEFGTRTTVQWVKTIDRLVRNSAAIGNDAISLALEATMLRAESPSIRAAILEIVTNEFGTNFQN